VVEVRRMPVRCRAGRVPVPAALLLVAALAAPAVAQNIMVQNGDVETWVAATAPMTGQVPADWNLQWATGAPPTASMTTQSTSTATVHCGTSSCQVDVQSSWAEVGKQFLFAAPPTGALHARIRVLYPPASQQPSQSTAGTLTALVAGYAPGVWTPVAGSSSLTIAPDEHWQEFTLAYVPTASPTATLVRVNFTFANGNGQRFFVDSVDFTGTDATTYGTVPSPLAKQVRSTAFGLTYDDHFKRLRELRRVQNGFAVGPNFLDTTGSSPGSTLYNGSTRQTIAQTNGTWFDAVNHGTTATPITPSAGSNRTGWRFVGSGNNVTVDLGIYSEAGGEQIFFEPIVTPGNTMLEDFHCPTLRFAPYLGSGSSSELALPTGGGAVVKLDSAAFGQVMAMQGSETWVGGSYPGTAALQLLALYRADAGVALMAEDATGENKQFTAYLNGSSPRVDLTITHRLPSVLSLPPATFRRVLLPCVGDWRHAAEQYRDWVRKTRLWADAAIRPTAAWVAERPTVYEADLRPEGIGDPLVPLADWDRLMADWRVALGSSTNPAPMVPLFRSFEQHGTYIGPNYLPLQVLGTGPLGGPYPVLHNQASILASWLDVHNQGDRPMAMVAGLNWAKSRVGTLPRAGTGTCSGGADSYWVYSFPGTGYPVPGSVVQDRNGGDLLVQPSGGSWVYGHWVMDPRHSHAIGTHAQLARTMATGGLDLYLFDQMNGGGVPDNFDTAYATPGAGAWKAGGIRTLFAATKLAGATVNPDFELSIEDPCELSIDLIAVQGIRSDQMLAHPAPDFGSGEAIPLFPFVFHEVVSFVNWDLHLGTDWLMTRPWAAATAPLVRQLDVVELARTMTAGAWLATGLQPWMLVNEYVTGLGSGIPPCGTSPGQAMMPWWWRAESVGKAFLQACVATSRGPARRHLNDGMMVRTTGLVASGTVQVALDPWTAGSPTIDQPKIHHSAFEYGPTNHGLLLANVDLTPGATVSVTLPSKLGNRTLTTGTTITVHVNGGTPSTLTWAPGLTYPVPSAAVVFMTM
jgi:hypothetical protein